MDQYLYRYMCVHSSICLLYDVFLLILGWDKLSSLSATANLKVMPGWCSMMTRMARRASAATRRRTARKRRRRTRKSTRRTRILRRLELRQASHMSPHMVHVHCSHSHSHSCVISRWHQHDRRVAVALSSAFAVTWHLLCLHKVLGAAITTTYALLCDIVSPSQHCIGGEHSV